MANYSVTHKCGHTNNIDLIGKVSTREWVISKKEQELCPTCEKEARSKAIAAKAEQIKAETSGVLPELTGTEKQINWAVTLRDKMLNDVKIFEKVEGYTEFVNFISAKEDAKFWIDSREVNWNTVRYRVREEYEEFTRSFDTQRYRMRVEKEAAFFLFFKFKTGKLQ